MKSASVLALLIALCSPALGQHGISVSATRPAPPGAMRSGHFSAGISVVERGHRRPFSRNPYFGYGFPYFYADDYGREEVEYVRQEPAPQPPAPVQSNPEPLPEPVLLELHGTQWVKVANFGEASESALKPAAQISVAKEPPAAVLVYRDGHSEEVSSYSIIGRVMYTKADYYASGSWTRTIQLADLDIPATLQRNQQRGVKFDLPSGPDEVVIRP